MSGVERGKEDTSVVPDENGERTGHQQHPADALERSQGHPEPNPETLLANVERLLCSRERLLANVERLLRSGKRPVSWTLDRDPGLLETNVPGIFVVGDVRHGSVKRVASGVGEGAVVVQFMHQYLAKVQ